MRGPSLTAGLLLGLILSLAASSRAAGQCAPTTDCNSNGVLDSCDITLGTSDDCNGNGIPDECDITVGTTPDCNFNGVPDPCEPAPPFLLAPTGGFAAASSVAIRGNFAVVGSTLDSSAAPTAGAVHVFRRVGTTWIQDGPELVASDAASGDLFGAAVSVDGDFIAIGAPGDDFGATGNTGSVYVFRRSLGTWLQIAKLTLAGPLAGDEFGSAVSIRGNRLLAGAPMGGGSGAGKAVIYAFDGLSWSVDALLQPPTLVAGDRFGSAVSLAITHAFVGAWGRLAGGAAGAGQTFVYELSGTWGLATTLADPTPQASAAFGFAVAGSDALLVVGAPNQDSLAGAAHLFEKAGGVWSHTAEFASPAATPAQQFGRSVALGVTGGRVSVTELEDPGPPVALGLAHVFHRIGNAWYHLSSSSEGGAGDDYGRRGATDGRYAVVSAPGIPAAWVHWVAPVADCNGNGIDDFCDINQGVSADCNANTVPDTCDLAAGTSADCDGDQTPDDCELAQNPGLDCNLNGILDSCDIAAGLSLDCNANGTPDECDISQGTETDCDGNAVPDSCQGISDTQDPSITNVPGSISTGTDPGLCTAAVTWTEPTITDNCGIDSVVRSHIPGADFPVGATTVTYTATDVAGNVASASFSVIVADTTGPAIIGLPASFSVPSTPGLCSAVVSWTPPTASDGCGLVSLTSNFQPGATRPVGVTTVTYTAIDVYANVTQASFTITVLDQVAPTIVALPSSQTLTALPGSCGRIATWSAPGVSDNCASPALSVNFPSGSFFPVGVTTVTYTATDASGNSTSASFTVTVNDTTPPAISGLPTNQTLNLATGSCTIAATWTPPTASDNCGVQSLTSTHVPGVVLSAGTTAVTYTATDIHGLVTPATFTITVVDAQDPILSGVPGNISLVLAPGQCTAVATWTPPTATDNCSVSSLVGDAAPGFSFPVGVTLVTYIATDPSGNTASASFTITVSDLQPPTIPDLPPGVVAGTAAGVCQAPVSWTPPLGADNCTVVSVVSSHSPGQVFPAGNTVVTVTVTDASGNSASGNFTVTVFDDDLPVIAGLPANIAVSTGPGLCGAVVPWPAPSITDNCAVTASSNSHSPGATFPVGTTLVTYSASDAAGNVAQGSFTVTVTDAQPPVIAGMPPNATVGSAPGACAATLSWTPPTASDNCGIQLFSGNHIPGQSFPVGQTVVTYTAIDIHGNTTQASFTITVADNQPPALSVGPDIVVPGSGSGCSATVTVPLPTASDNCALASVSNDFTGTGDASGVYPLGTTAVVWTAIDTNGNPTIELELVTVTTPVGPDCNANGNPDACDIASGASEDCNENGIPDECDLAAGTAIDANGDGVLDICEQRFRRGDGNNDGTLNIADAIYLLGTLFIFGPAPPCLDAADANDDGFLDISDVIYTINYIFVGGAAPPAPFQLCGIDPTGGDLLECAVYSGCP